MAILISLSLIFYILSLFVAKYSDTDLCKHFYLTVTYCVILFCIIYAMIIGEHNALQKIPRDLANGKIECIINTTTKNGDIIKADTVYYYK